MEWEPEVCFQFLDEAGRKHCVGRWPWRSGKSLFFLLILYQGRVESFNENIAGPKEYFPGGI
jgi:hypothetical protein